MNAQSRHKLKSPLGPLGRCFAIACAALAALGAWPASVQAEEVYSNGYGGGRWSAESTWQGGQLPTASDTVVIAGRDTVTFDVSHPDSVTCAALALDPRSVLEFRTDSEKRVLTVAGKIETYGTIRLNARDNRNAHHEIRLVGENEEDRQILLKENGALLVYGNRSLAQTERNAVVRTAVLKEDEPEENDADAANGEDANQNEQNEQEKQDEPEDPAPMGKLDAPDKTMIDIQHARVAGLAITAEQIDNTGYQASERLNLIGNVMTDLTHVTLSHCDSATISQNDFLATGSGRGNPIAINLSRTNRTRIDKNVIENYKYGIYTFGANEPILLENTIKNCYHGIYNRGAGMMAKGNTIIGCGEGMRLLGGSGVFEDITIRESTSASILAYHNSTAQFNNCRVENFAGEEDRPPLLLSHGKFTVLNCNFTPDMVQMSDNPDVVTEVTWIYPLTVQVTGDVPAGAQVMIHRVDAGLPENAPDPYTRNVPAPLDGSGLTPRAGIGRVITVQAATLSSKKGKTDPPRYRITVQQPPSKEGESTTVLATQTVQPDDSWYRPDVRTGEPTVTIELNK